jgi:hypothetical protein
VLDVYAGEFGPFVDGALDAATVSRARELAERSRLPE